MGMIRGVPLRLPQARDLDKLRRLLELVAHETDLDAIGTAMGAGKTHARRHASYYREAAEILGMIERGALSVTARGVALLDSPPGQARECVPDDGSRHRSRASFQFRGDQNRWRLASSLPRT